MTSKLRNSSTLTTFHVKASRGPSQALQQAALGKRTVTICSAPYGFPRTTSTANTRTSSSTITHQPHPRMLSRKYTTKIPI